MVLLERLLQIKIPAVFLKLVSLIMLLLAFLANGATAFISTRLVFPNHGYLGVILGMICLCLVGAVLIFFRKDVVAVIRKTADFLPNLTIFHLVFLGLFLRIVWLVLFPAAPASDGAVYLHLAQKLAAGQEYSIANTRSYWPPGYPLLLIPFVWLLGAGSLAVVCLNVLLYFSGIMGVWKLAEAFAGARAARLACLIFAVWPNLVAIMGTPDKEQAIIALLPWAMLLLYRSVDDLRIARVLIAGVLVGFAALAQPSLLLWPTVCFAFLWFCSSLRIALIGSLVFVLGMILVISPWTIRNWSVFDAFVPVATNGGGNLYRANNPLATGGYTKRGEVDLSNLDELEANHLGQKLALEWIGSHPVDFLKLSWEKMLRFMGDDAAGLYSSLKLGGSAMGAVAYPILKLVANLFWMGLWVLIAVGIVSAIAGRCLIEEVSWTGPVLMFLYLFSLHVVFESSGKYHMPAAWALCVLIGFLYGYEGKKKHAT